MSQTLLSSDRIFFLWFWRALCDRVPLAKRNMRLPVRKFVVKLVIIRLSGVEP